jgi:hypothetical protein
MSGCDNPLPRRMPAKPNPRPYVPADTKLLHIETQLITLHTAQLYIHDVNTCLKLNIADHSDIYGLFQAPFVVRTAILEKQRHVLYDLHEKHQIYETDGTKLHSGIRSPRVLI